MERRDEELRDSTQGRIERAKEAALGPHDDTPSLADEVSEAAGGISGVLAGAAIGSAGGPVGTLIGGIAGAVGGWWAGRAISEAASALTEDDDAHYRRHYESSPDRPADRSYDDVVDLYRLGQIAAHNPNFVNRTFEEVEPELQRGWTDEIRARHGEWQTARPYAQEGYARASGQHRVVRDVDNGR